MKNFFKQNKWAQYILFAIGLVFAWRTYKSFADKGKAAKEAIKNSALAQAIADAVKTISPIRAQEVVKIADNIYAALFNYRWGMAEDEEAAAAEINSLLSVDEAIACAVVYSNVYKRRLFSDLYRYIQNPEYNSMRQSLLQAIKSK